MLINVIVWILILSILFIGFVIESKLTSKRFGFPFLTFTLLIFYHEFIFINLQYYLEIDHIVLSSSWKELILISFASFYFLIDKIRSLSKIGLITLIFAMFYVSLGLLLSLPHSFSSFSESILIGKRYIFPFLFLCALTLIPDSKVDIKKSCNIFFYVVIIPNFLFGIWELFSVKNLDDLWFYAPLVSTGNNFESFNHFRSDYVRANGFFVGTLTYAATAFCSFLFFFILRKDRFSYMKMAVSFSMLLLSQTRTFFIGLIFFFLLYFVTKKISSKRVASTSIVFLLLTSFITILFSLPYLTSEFSAIGRIYQWKNALELAFSYPMGQGFSSIGLSGDNRADSQIIDFIRIYGVFMVPMLFCFISWIVFHWNKARLLPFRNDIEIPFISITSYIFILFFQSLVDVTVLYFILLLTFKYRNNKQFNYA